MLDSLLKKRFGKADAPGVPPTSSDPGSGEVKPPGSERNKSVDGEEKKEEPKKTWRRNEKGQIILFENKAVDWFAAQFLRGEVADPEKEGKLETTAKIVGLFGLNTIGSIAGYRVAWELPGFLSQSAYTSAEKKRIKSLFEEAQKILPSKEKASQAPDAFEEKKKELLHGIESSKHLTEIKKEELKKEIDLIFLKNGERTKKADKKRKKELAGTLDLYIQTKITGLSATREVVNTLLVASGYKFVRGAAYGILAAADRLKRVQLERKEGKRAGGFMEEWVVNGFRETYSGLKFEGKDAKERAINAAKAYGTLARIFGIGASAATEIMDQGARLAGLGDDVRDALHGQINLSWKEAGANLAQNEADVWNAPGKMKDFVLSLFGNGKAEAATLAASTVPETRTTGHMPIQSESKVLDSGAPRDSFTTTSGKTVDSQAGHMPLQDPLKEKGSSGTISSDESAGKSSSESPPVPKGPSAEAVNRAAGWEAKTSASAAFKTLVETGRVAKTPDANSFSDLLEKQAKQLGVAHSSEEAKQWAGKMVRELGLYKKGSHDIGLTSKAADEHLSIVPEKGAKGEWSVVGVKSDGTKLTIEQMKTQGYTYDRVAGKAVTTPHPTEGTSGSKKGPEMPARAGAEWDDSVPRPLKPGEQSEVVPLASAVDRRPPPPSWRPTQEELNYFRPLFTYERQPNGAMAATDVNEASLATREITPLPPEAIGHEFVSLMKTKTIPFSEDSFEAAELNEAAKRIYQETFLLGALIKRGGGETAEAHALRRALSETYSRLTTGYHLPLAAFQKDAHALGIVFPESSRAPLVESGGLIRSCGPSQGSGEVFFSHKRGFLGGVKVSGIKITGGDETEVMKRTLQFLDAQGKGRSKEALFLEKKLESLSSSETPISTKAVSVETESESLAPVSEALRFQYDDLLRKMTLLRIDVATEKRLSLGEEAFVKGIDDDSRIVDLQGRIDALADRMSQTAQASPKK